MRSEVRCLLTDTEYTPLAYSKDKLDGKLAHVFLADEVGAMDSYPVEAMRSSQVVLKDKLGILISTKYPAENNGLVDEIDFAKKQLDGLYDGRRRYFSLLYEPDDELIKNWQTDDNVLYQANPVAVRDENLFEELLAARSLAILYENKRENFLCKHCNIQYQGLGTEGYIDIVKVKECSVPEDLSFWRGRRVWLGLDLSLSEDNVAAAMSVIDDDDIVHAKVWAFIPKDRVEVKSEKEGVDYKRHIAAGECFACGDEVIDYGFVERFILGLKDKYGVEIQECAYDRWNAVSTVQKLENDERNPIQCLAVPQVSKVLHAPTKWLKECVLSGKFRYDAKDNYYLPTYKDLMGFYDDTYHGVLFVNKQSGDGLLVNSEGYNYARYSQFIPNARDIIQKHEQSLAIDDLKTHMDCCINNWLEQHKNETNICISLTEFINDSSLAEILADYASESIANHPQIACCQIIDGVIDAEKQELVETRLYCPLKIMIEDEDDCCDLIEVDSANYIDYDFEINAHIRDDLESDEDAVERGLAAYFHDENLDKKVYSIMPKVETRNGELYGVAVVKSYGELDKSELLDLTNEIRGQLSDGWGEGYEQREIRLGDDTAYISFWNSDDYFLKPESEVFPENKMDITMGGLS